MNNNTILLTMFKALKPGPRNYQNVVEVKDGVATATDGYFLLQVKLPTMDGDRVIKSDLSESSVRFPAHANLWPTRCKDLELHVMSILLKSKAKGLVLAPNGSLNAGGEGFSTDIINQALRGVIGTLTRAEISEDKSNPMLVLHFGENTKLLIVGRAEHNSELKG